LKWFCIIAVLSILGLAAVTTAASDEPQVSINDKIIYKGYKEYKIQMKNLSEGAAVLFTSNNTKVAKVNGKSGIVTPVNKGKAIITIKIKQNGKSYTDKINITVKNPYIKMIASISELTVGESFTFKAKTYGMDGSLKWSISDNSLAEINSSNGELTSKKPGWITITSVCKGIKANCEVEIKVPFDKYEDIWSYTIKSEFPKMVLYSVEQAPNHNIYVSGSENENAFVALISPEGKLLWKNTYGGSDIDHADLLLPLENGDCIIAGGTYSNDGDIKSSYGKCDYWLFRIDQKGSILWSKCYGGGGCDFMECIIQTSDGNLVFSGTSFSQVLMYATVYKVDINTGALIWQQSYDGSGSEVFKSIEETSDGGFIATGNTYSIDGNFIFRNKTEQSNAFWISKLDCNGSMEWQDCREVDEYNVSFLGGIATHETSDGSFLSMAASYDGNSVLYKYSSSGRLIWSKELELKAYDYRWQGDINLIARTYDMQLTEDGGCICYGYSYGGTLIKLNCNGNVEYEFYTDSYRENFRYISLSDNMMIISYQLADDGKNASFTLTCWKDK